MTEMDEMTEKVEMTENKVRSAQRVVETLSAYGVRYVFGVPGAKIDAVYDALVDGGPELVVCRHEQNAAFMAAAIGRLTGTPGVALVTSGPGHHQPGHRTAHRQHRAGPVSPSAARSAAPTASSAPTNRWMPPRSSRPVTKYTGEVNDADNVPKPSSTPSAPPLTEPRGAAAVVLPADVLQLPPLRRPSYHRYPVPALARRAGRPRSRAAADLIRPRNVRCSWSASEGGDPTAVRRCASCFASPTCPSSRHFRAPA